MENLLKKPEEYLNIYPILNNDPVFETKEMPFNTRKKALRYAFGIMRKTMYRSWTRRLSKLGFVGKVLAFLYTAKITQDVFLRNKFLRKIIYKTANKFIT